MTIRLAGISLICLLCPAPLLVAASGLDPAGAGMSRERIDLIHQRMKEFVDAGKTAGIVTLIARHGKVASLDAVGYQDLESRKPMTSGALFRIASLTKPITCAAIMVLVDQGKLSVIDPVEKFIPEYKGLTVNRCPTSSGYGCESLSPRRPINIEDLMAHTSGLPAAADSGGHPPASLAEQAALGAKTRLLFDPGTAWNYTNLGYDILGRIIEIASRLPYDQFLAKNIFEPLGMKNTGFELPPEKTALLASLYKYEDGGLKPVPSPLRAAFPAPGGGLISTAHDLLQFNEMMLRNGTLNGTRVLSPAAVELMTTSHTGDMTVGWSPGVGHGYGFEVVTSPRGMFRYSSMNTFEKGGAFRTYEIVDRDKDMVAIILMQRTNGGGDVADEINTFAAMAAAAIEH